MQFSINESYLLYTYISPDAVPLLENFMVTFKEYLLLPFVPLPQLFMKLVMS